MLARSILQAFIGLALALQGAPNACADANPAVPNEIGRRFMTDNSIRAGFEAIRAIVLRTHTLVTHRRLSKDGADAFAAEILRELDRMMMGTVADGKARAELAALAASIEAAAKKIAAAPVSTAAMDGIVAIDEALQRYAQSFEHPGWRPLR